MMMLHHLSLSLSLRLGLPLARLGLRPLPLQDRQQRRVIRPPVYESVGDDARMEGVEQEGGGVGVG
jgi:hypothetical protein